MIASFKFNFSAGQVSDEYMFLELKFGNQIKQIETKDIFCVNVDIALPTTIEFHLGNRKDNDTITSNGEIVADKFIRIDSLEIDGFFIESWQLPEESFYFETDQHTKIFSYYWSRNGVAKLIIDKDDAALWLLDCKKIITDK
jgi:hypothetical protein